MVKLFLILLGYVIRYEDHPSLSLPSRVLSCNTPKRNDMPHVGDALVNLRIKDQLVRPEHRRIKCTYSGIVYAHLS